MEAPAAVEEPAETAKPIEEAAEAPAFHSETVAVYPPVTKTRTSL